MKNAEYFRKLQGVTPIEEQVDKAVEHILKSIEKHIKNGNKEQYLNFSFNSFDRCYHKLISKLTELDFKIYHTELCCDGKFKLTVSWSE